MSWQAFRKSNKVAVKEYWGGRLVYNPQGKPMEFTFTVQEWNSIREITKSAQRYEQTVLVRKTLERYFKEHGYADADEPFYGDRERSINYITDAINEVVPCERTFMAEGR